MKKITVLVSVVTLLIGFVSCDKKEIKQTPVETRYGMLKMHLHNYIEESEVDAYNITYTNSDGRAIKLNMAQLYMSDFELEKMDGTFHKIPNTIVLKIQDAETYNLGMVPVGNYKSVRFKVGLPSAVNAKTPTTADSILFDANMWFADPFQSNGFAFVNVRGSIDTTTNADGSAPMQNFNYLIGTNANYTQVQMPQKNFSITEDQAYYAHMYSDWNRLFTGITLNNAANLEVTSIADNSSATAQKLAANLSKLFVYE
jgi:hypothetical protein